MKPRHETPGRERCGANSIRYHRPASLEPLHCILRQQCTVLSLLLSLISPVLHSCSLPSGFSIHTAILLHPPFYFIVAGFLFPSSPQPALRFLQPSRGRLDFRCQRHATRFAYTLSLGNRRPSWNLDRRSHFGLFTPHCYYHLLPSLHHLRAGNNLRPTLSHSAHPRLGIANRNTHSTH